MKKLISILLVFCCLLSGCSVTLSIVEPTTPSVSSEDELYIHFIDVGQADCFLIEYGNYHMLIDGGNRDDSDLVVTYLEQQGVQELDAVICTHAHEDHVGGLPAVLAVYPTDAVYAPTKTYSSKVFDDFLYYVNQQGREVIIPAPGDTFHLGDVQVTILGPVRSYAETNDTSIVCRIDYGETSFLFTGDMETAAENDMLDYWEKRNSGDIVDVDVLKVGHHGSNSSTGYRLLYAADPAYGVISCGQNNDYGHPHKEPLSRLNQAGVTLFRTDKMGHILAHSDGEEITFTWENQGVDPDNADPESQLYIGNKNSRKFHYTDCPNLPAPDNQVAFSSYDEAISRGYQPCGNCLG